MICATFGSVMQTIFYVIVAIIVLLTMVLIHETGHYVVGRLLGFKIVEFSIGFGKAIWQRKNKRGELISIRIFPLGGYCAFYGEGENDSKENEEKQNSTQDVTLDVKSDTQSLEENKSTTTELLSESSEKPVKFNDQKPWKRILVFIAGVTFNFVSAFIFSIIFLCVGAYDGYSLSPTVGYDVKYAYENITQEYVYDKPLKENTIVYAINGTEINYARGNVFASLVKSEDNIMRLTIDENGTKVNIVISKAFTDEDGNAVFGINYSNLKIDYNFGDVLRDFIPFTFDISVLILKAFWQIITGQIALNQLGGPISTIQQITVVTSYGLANFLYLLPLLAANLAIFNILPIPGLDGAHVIFTTIEWIRGKPIKRSVENAIHTWGIILLFAFVIVIDIVHLITAI